MREAPAPTWELRPGAQPGDLSLLLRLLLDLARADLEREQAAGAKGGATK